MVFASVPSYLDPPHWNQTQHQQSPPGVLAPQAQVLHAGEVAVGGMGEGALQLPQPLSSMPPRPDSGMGASTVRPTSMAERARLVKSPQAPEQALKCPRCDSTNTKFCYFNNYSLSQPRHFCKTCRRYWTRGGALRNVPVGGGCRRNKRSKSSVSKSATAERAAGNPTAVNILASGGAGVGATISIPQPSPQLPFLGSFHGLQDYGTPTLGMSYDPAQFQFGSSSSGIAGLDQWRLQHIQQLPFYTGIMEQPSVAAAHPPSSSLGLYQLDTDVGIGGVTSFSGHVHGKHTASGLISQLASVKMEDSSHEQLNLKRQYLGLNPGGDHYWNGSGNGGTGSPGWTDLSGPFGPSSAGNLM